MIMCRRRVWLLVDSRQKDLFAYRLSQAEDSIKVAKMSYESSLFKDSINRSYYAAFYVIKAVVALVDKSWCQYFINETPKFCGHIGDKVVSF